MRVVLAFVVPVCVYFFFLEKASMMIIGKVSGTREVMNVFHHVSKKNYFVDIPSKTALIVGPWLITIKSSTGHITMDIGWSLDQ